jgi:hypothetical protein
MKQYYKESLRKRISSTHKKKRQANLIGHSLCRNCLLKHGTEGKIEGRIEVKGRRRIRRKQLLDNLKEKNGCW